MNNIKVINNKNNPTKLFRANKDLYDIKGNLIYTANKNKNILASINYTNAPVKYFTLNRKEVNAYTKKGKTYIKNWSVTEKLKLIDILDLSTRMALEYEFKNDIAFQKAITDAFPIIDNKVYRNSSSVIQDNIVLNKICGTKYDGYYMKAPDSLLSKNEKSFHSEVGLCNKAFDKLTLAENPEKSIAAPSPKSKGTRRKHWESSNNSNNNNRRTKRNRLQIRQLSF